MASEDEIIGAAVSIVGLGVIAKAAEHITKKSCNTKAPKYKGWM